MLKDEKKPIHLDTLVRKCGYFNTDTNVNNCYGCDHPEQDETELDEDTGKEQGRCHSFTCPIASELCPNEEPEDRKYFEDGKYGWKSCTDGDWMLVYGLTKREMKELKE